MDEVAKKLHKEFLKGRAANRTKLRKLESEAKVKSKPKHLRDFRINCNTRI